MLPRPSLACFLTLATLTLPLLAQTSTSPNPDLTPLLQRLASDNFTTREAAQKELSQLSYKSRPTLLKLADQTTDPEVKSRLQLRIQQIDEDLAFNPPPISLHIKNANSAALTEALSKALNMPVLINSYSLDPMTTPNYSYTLDVDEQPYWDVYAKLSQQSYLHIRPPGEPLALPVFRLRNYQRFGPIVIFQQETSRQVQVKFRGPKDEDAITRSNGVSFMIAADPRIKIVSATQPFIKQIIDASGKVISQSDPTQTAGSLQFGRWYEECPLPENPGANLEAVGEIKLTVQLSAIRREIDHPEQHLKEPIEIGSCVVTIDSFNLRPSDPNTALANATARNANPNSPVSMTFAIIDSTGKAVASSTSMLSQMLLGFSLQATGKGPFKILLTTPDKTRDLTIPFKLPLVTQ